MILFIILTVLSLAIAIYLFLIFNNGYGSLKKKRPLYFFSLLAFLASIYFFIKAYYFNDNKELYQIQSELIEEFNEYEKLHTLKNTNSDILVQDVQKRLDSIVQKLNDKAVINKYSLDLFKGIQKQIINIDSILSIKDDATVLEIKKIQHNINKLISDIDRKTNKEKDTWFAIIISIICAFVVFVFGFTFKNKILF